MSHEAGIQTEGASQEKDLRPECWSCKDGGYVQNAGLVKIVAMSKTLAL